MDAKQFPLNKPVRVRRFFVRVKLATLDADGSGVADTRFLPDQVLEASTMTEALEEAYTLYNPENPEHRWLSFEVFEEEVVTTRRILHASARTTRQVNAMVGYQRENRNAGETQTVVDHKSTHLMRFLGKRK